VLRFFAVCLFCCVCDCDFGCVDDVGKEFQFVVILPLCVFAFFTCFAFYFCSWGGGGGRPEKIRSIHNVNHVQFIETFEDEASVFLVMELASGPSLVDYVEENGPLPESVVIKVSSIV
jgi:hypothetical protein